MEQILTRIPAFEQLQKFCEHEQAGTRLNFASKSSKGQILRAVENFYDHSIALLDEAEYDMKNYADRGVTPSKICIILQIIRKPNSIVVLSFIQLDGEFKPIRNGEIF